MENKPENFSMVLQENSIEPSEAEALQAIFAPMLQQVESWKAEAESITITSPDQVDDMQKARDLRLKLKNVRVEADKKRKEMKEESLRRGRAIDGMFNIIKFLIVPLEEKLQKDEDFIKEAEEKRLNELEEKRVNELRQYDVDCSFYKLRDMDEETYQTLLKNSKKAFEEKKEKERKEEEERIKREEAEREEQRKKDEELEKLRKEREEREAKEAEEKAKHEEELRIEREKKEKAEAELKKKQEEERKAKEEEERKKKEEEEARRREEEERRKAPDKEKLQALKMQVAGLEMPKCQTPEGRAVVEGVNKLMTKVVKYINDNTLNL